MLQSCLLGLVVVIQIRLHLGYHVMLRVCRVCAENVIVMNADVLGGTNSLDGKIWLITDRYSK